MMVEVEGGREERESLDITGNKKGKIGARY
jgi:hypothetical protein